MLRSAKPLSLSCDIVDRKYVLILRRALKLRSASQVVTGKTMICTRIFLMVGNAIECARIFLMVGNAIECAYFREAWGVSGEVCEALSSMAMLKPF